MASKSLGSGYDRRSCSGCSDQLIEKRIGLRKYKFWSKTGEDNKSMNDINEKPLQVGPPMTLLSGGHSRKPRRTCSSPIRYMPKIKNISLKKTQEISIPDDLNILGMRKASSKMSRHPILRPHSSPVRYNTIKQIYRDNDFDSIVSSAEIKSPPESITYHRSHAYGAGEAYFSSKPPIAPIRLVITGAANQNPRVQRYLKAMHQIDQAQTAEDRRRSARSLATEPALSISTCSTPVKKQRGKNRKLNRFVKTMVKDLVENLPLVQDAPVQVSNVKASPNMRDMRTSPTPTRKARRDFGQFNDDYSRCSIAVQAFMQQTSRTDIPLNTDIYTSPSTTKSDHQSTEDWIGGVRALRDSHVRLVLRQLRHITCLNRALDRATRTGIPY